MTILYPDVSNVNWTDTATWTPEGQQNLMRFLTGLRGAGFSGLVHKVSQGASFRDPYWQACRVWCEANDTSWLGYHYVTLDNPDEQAANFVVNNGGENVMLDFETGSGDMGNFWLLVNAFNNAGVNVSLAYVPHWYLNSDAGGHGDLSQLTPNRIALVSSAYPDGGGTAQDIYRNGGGDTGEGWLPYNGGGPSVWQFTDKAFIAGFVVDCNAYKGENLDVLFTS